MSFQGMVKKSTLSLIVMTFTFEVLLSGIDARANYKEERKRYQEKVKLAEKDIEDLKKDIAGLDQKISQLTSRTVNLSGYTGNCLVPCSTVHDTLCTERDFRNNNFTNNEWAIDQNNNPRNQEGCKLLYDRDPEMANVSASCATAMQSCGYVKKKEDLKKAQNDKKDKEEALKRAKDDLKSYEKLLSKQNTDCKECMIASEYGLFEPKEKKWADYAMEALPFVTQLGLGGMNLGLGISAMNGFNSNYRAQLDLCSKVGVPCGQANYMGAFGSMNMFMNPMSMMMNPMMMNPMMMNPMANMMPWGGANMMPWGGANTMNPLAALMAGGINLTAWGGSNMMNPMMMNPMMMNPMMMNPMASMMPWGGANMMPWGGANLTASLWGGVNMMPWGGQNMMPWGGQNMMPWGGQNMMPWGGQNMMPWGRPTIDGPVPNPLNGGVFNPWGGGALPQMGWGVNGGVQGQIGYPGGGGYFPYGTNGSFTNPIAGLGLGNPQFQALQNGWGSARYAGQNFQNAQIAQSSLMEAQMRYGQALGATSGYGYGGYPNMTMPMGSGGYPFYP